MGFQDDTAIYQTATMGALLGGVYDGDVSVADLLAHGDFGVGTFNGLDGEMLLLDGRCYQLRSDGSASVVDGAELVPFAAVTPFRPQHTVELDGPTGRDELADVIDREVGSANLMAAIRVEATFSSLRTRTVERQHRPYPRFTDVAAGESECDFTDIRGTMAGFRMPGWVQGISVAGYHLHFIDDDRRRGGHVLDYRIARGTVTVEVCSAFHLRLPQTAGFEGADLSGGDVDDQIRRTEGG